MALYEHVMMARQDISSQQAKALSEHFKEVLEQNGGSAGKVEHWGLRPLAYKIRKNRKAHYILMNINAPTKAVNEMERQMYIHEDILRFLTIRVDEHQEEQSVIMHKREDSRTRRADDSSSNADEAESAGSKAKVKTEYKKEEV